MLVGRKKETSQSLIELQSYSEIKSGSVLRVVECGEAVGKRSALARAGGDKEPALQSTWRERSIAKALRPRGQQGEVEQW